MRNLIIRHTLALLAILVLPSSASIFLVDAFASSSTSIHSAVPRCFSLPSPGTPTYQNLHLITKLRAGAIQDDSKNNNKNPSSFITRAVTYANNNFFLVGMLVAVALAKTVPSFGVNGSILRPELSIGKYGVGLIFLLSGLSLKGSELSKAVSNVKLNSLIQVSIFGAWPFLVGVPLRNILSRVNLVPPALVDGLLIMTCLPTTVNMCIMLTSSSGGNVASSICNAVISNMAGIFVTPALLFHFFGANIKLPFLQMVLKLCKKVLLPVAIGQALRATKAKDIYESNSKGFKRLQEVRPIFFLFSNCLLESKAHIVPSFRSSSWALYGMPFVMHSAADWGWISSIHSCY